MNETVKYNNDFNLLPMPELKAIQMDMFMGIIALVREKKENTPFLKHFFDPDKRKIVIPQKKFIEICRLNDSNLPYPKIYYGLDDCLKKLCNFVISYQKDEKTLYNFVCFEEANFIFDEVHIVLQSRFYDMIINKKYGFTRFELAEFIALSGKYTKTLYRLLKQFRSTGIAKFEWSEFARIMKIPENYRQIDIDARILKPALKELTKENNLFDQNRVCFKNLAYEKEKAKGTKGRGGKVIGITFTFKPENIKLQEIENAENINQALKNLINQKWIYQDELLQVISIDNLEVTCNVLERDEYENLFSKKTTKITFKNQKELIEEIAKRIC